MTVYRDRRDARRPDPCLTRAFMGYSMPWPYANARTAKAVAQMRSLSAFLIAATALTATAFPAVAGPRERDQESAFRGAQAGRIIPLRAIEQRIVPLMRGFDYLGPEYYADIGRYRLKFLRGQRVVWIDVDARTGEVIGKSGF
jgi:hypothetical protein